MTKEEQIDLIQEGLFSQITSECDSCHKIVGIIGDGMYDDTIFAEELYKKGWRYKDEKCLCPKCVKSKTK